MAFNLRIGVIGIDHGHIYGMINGMLDAGATLVAWTTGEETPEAVRKTFQETYPDLPARPMQAILDDESIVLVLSAAINSDRAHIAVAAMSHGKDVLVDKPGCTNLEQLADIQRTVGETGRRWVVSFSERVSVESATLADQLVAEGRIGKVVQTVGLGPHRLNAHLRPDWFWDRARCGGILADICAHQFDQFLHYTGSTEARVVSAHVTNVANPHRPGFQDFGEVLLEGNGGRGYARVDWLTPDGLPVWGDGRMTILGTEGYIELRKYIDIAGHEGQDHVFVVDKSGVQRFEARGAGKPFFARLAGDVERRTETAMAQSHALLATRLGLQAQLIAEEKTDR
ncbi:Gfo/Idh/MocA family oxidoreductase [Neorhizobium galegae]|uniref:Gfo/Idh/MocA family protein n=1 Tax=Neorhizobium galegae TaxID=399 RepID=UPI0006211DCD|nr:Gfo/Idh/MocA family oxidoreductase [Neorhizobium galegae]CDZ34634.1 Oxidoreductase family protein [Neorhizobium galegae bv. officinalis]MCQ1768365.1 Gfo/Idh/MocA family oxidoreductase [Neorhizobium galegae]MCQ1776116.1 Gfo/Idh/MocA family oxidoreductase [Neorhizobium galegae]MCQ1798796.1 Gfo/Idh/MocA family oxidoreductase [Neorhizobium galegae]MCQ1847337.1 Gfo/Idh/MocA family oxidoreductase [Neorhizobium galegae]